MELIFAYQIQDGTTALELKTPHYLEERSEIIIPDLTFAVSNAATSKGHIPVCVDVSPLDWNMNQFLKRTKSGLTQKTKGIIVVHSYYRTFNKCIVKKIRFG